MGLFSKSKPQNPEMPPEATLRIVITKFQGWLGTYEPTEINDKKYELVDLEKMVDFLVRKSAEYGDEMMLQWTSKACVAMDVSTVTEAKPEVFAQVIFDATVGSMDLRKKYVAYPDIVNAITVLGVASIKTCERFPNYKDALEYMRANSEKLAGK